MTSTKPKLDNLAFYNYEPPVVDITREVLAGLCRQQPVLHPKFLYDARGSRLFEAITHQPEYYPTTAEKTLLARLAPELAQLVPENTLLAEPGAGNCDKVRLLLEHWQPRGYMPIEISHDELLNAAWDLAAENPRLAIHAVRADYTSPVEWPDDASAPRLVFFPGSTLGNFDPADRVPFMQRLRELAGDGGSLLLGVDLHKDSAVLHAAYNDAAGYTAAFNQNILYHLNSVLGAGFDPKGVDHVAFYNESERRVEMHLRFREDQDVTIDDQTLRFIAGTSIHTESSYKFTRPQLQDLLEDTGFALRHWWETPEPRFALCLADAV
ncbi:MAG: L-histidine N(alpha)-methyltransferase [Pseudomonadota bacterium]